MCADVVKHPASRLSTPLVLSPAAQRTPVRDLAERIAVTCPEIARWRLIGGAALTWILLHRRTDNLNFVAGREARVLGDGSIDMVRAALHEVGMETVPSVGPALYPTFLIDQIPVSFAIRPTVAAPGIELVLARAQLKRYGFIRSFDLATLFDMKLLAALNRESAADVFDLWAMTYGTSALLPPELFVERLRVLWPDMDPLMASLKIGTRAYPDWKRLKMRHAVSKQRVLMDIAEAFTLR